MSRLFFSLSLSLLSVSGYFLSDAEVSVGVRTIFLLLPLLFVCLSLLSCLSLPKESAHVKRCICRDTEGVFLLFVCLVCGGLLTVGGCAALAVLLSVLFLLSCPSFVSPLFLLFGFHVYDIETEKGTKVRVMKRGRVVRRSNETEWNGLRRVSDAFFVEF